MGPTPIWYAARGLGMILLLVLSGNVALGVLTSRHWRGRSTPGFLIAGLHRNLALLAMPLLALHGLTMILDPYAGLGLRDITIPFASGYRPLWLGLGVLAGEMLVGVVATSLLRARLGYRLWRLVHWATYISWPMALLHGLGTGSDTRAAWALVIYAACVLAVLVAILARLFAGDGARSSWRGLIAALSVVGTLALLIWTAAGPLRPGWALAAGTPKRLVAGSTTPTPAPSTSPTPSPTPSGIAAGLNDPLSVTVGNAGNALVLTMVDRNDSALHISVTIPSQTATSGPMVVRVSGQIVCQTNASLASGITATCGRTQLTMQIQQLDDGSLTGQLTTQGEG